MTTARVAAQAKINAFLRVLRRRADGFHELETLFLRVALADAVTVTATRGPRTLAVHGGPDLGPAERNLAWRAAAAYAAATGWPLGWAITIEKRIPVGGGLGGGSADAAAVLRALDAMAPAPLGPERVVALGATLGADVAFLAGPHRAALGRGRGEVLCAVAGPPTVPIALVVPPFGVPTAAAYAALAAARGPAPPRAPRTFAPDAFDTWDRVAAIAENDFEPVVFAQHPALASVRAALGGVVARLTGSGSALFAVGGLPPAVPAGWTVLATEGPVAAAPVRVK